MQIHPAKPEQSQAIQQIYLNAFSSEENQLVAEVAKQLLRRAKEEKNFNFVAETNGQVVAHVAFSPVLTQTNCIAYILAPLAVDPKFQRQGIGTKLVETALLYLNSIKVNIVLVYGDPDYYARFGFSAKAAKDYHAPYDLEFPQGWQAIELKQCKQEKKPLTLTCVEALDNPDLW